MNKGSWHKPNAFTKQFWDKHQITLGRCGCLGLIECQRGNFTAALRPIGQALKLDPNDASAHMLIGYALVELKRYPEALVSCDRALAIKPDLPEALNNRGIALLGLTRHGRRSPAVTARWRSGPTLPRL